MSELLISPKTEYLLGAFFSNPSHALALVAPSGAGKGALAHFVAAKVLDVHEDKLDSYPYFRAYKPEKNVITIEMARDITSYLKLKTTGKRSIRRVVIIEDAHTMTLEAQNALLKLIEEPPADTVLILTINNVQSVLPTIKSRVQAVNVRMPAEKTIAAYFEKQGYKSADIKRAYLISGGLPGLMQALLDGDSGHPLARAIDQAKTILQADTFERLTMIDDIAKQKELPDLLFALKQTAHAALVANSKQAGREKVLERWTLVYAKTLEAQDMLASNAQAKLVLTNLFLGL